MSILKASVPTIRQLVVWSIFPLAITVVSLPLVSLPVTRTLAVGTMVLVWSVTLISLFLQSFVAAILNPAAATGFRVLDILFAIFGCWGTRLAACFSNNDL